uniref:Uncharacterized protein n=1 Tax=Anopheles culicifacies TaxID=139723 RepID=A0A182M9A1_9DIPT
MRTIAAVGAAASVTGNAFTGSFFFFDNFVTIFEDRYDRGCYIWLGHHRNRPNRYDTAVTSQCTLTWTPLVTNWRLLKLYRRPSDAVTTTVTMLIPLALPLTRASTVRAAQIRRGRMERTATLAGPTRDAVRTDDLATAEQLQEPVAKLRRHQVVQDRIDGRVHVQHDAAEVQQYVEPLDTDRNDRLARHDNDPQGERPEW